MAAQRISSAASSATFADRSTQVLSLRNPSAGSARVSSTGMTGKPGSRPCRSSARSLSRCCQGPRPSEPRKTATELQDASVRSSACGHGCPGVRYQRSRKDAQTTLGQRACDRFHRGVVAPVIAEEDVEGPVAASHRVAPLAT